MSARGKKVSQRPPAGESSAAPGAAAPGGKPLRETNCNEHGVQVWQLDLVCTKCGTVYPGGEVAYPDFCSNCKVRLLPDHRNKAAEYWGRAACPLCARAQLGR